MTDGHAASLSASADHPSGIEGDVLAPEGGFRAPIRRIELAFALVLAISFAIGILSYRAIESFADVAALRQHASHTSAALEEVLRLVKEAETGQRGYLLTGEYEYLEPYEAARRSMESKFAQLRQLATADDVRTDRLNRISKLIDEKFLELAETIGVFRERGLDAAAKVVKTERGMEITDQIDRLVAEVRADNLARVREKSADLSREVRLAKALSVFGSGFALVYVFASALVIRRDFVRRARRRQDLFRRLIDTAEAVVLLRDPQGRIILYNPYTERISGRRLAETRGRDWLGTFVPEMEQPRMRETFARVLREGSASGYMSSLATRDGAVRVIDWNTQVLRDDAGKTIGVLSTGQDVTDRREIEKRAEQRERLADIGAIAAKIAHDLGNPLAAVSLQAQLVLRSIQKDGDQPLRTVTKPLVQLAGEVRRLESLIRELLGFAREQRLELQPLDARRLVEDVARLWLPVASAQRIVLRTEIRGPAVRLEADESKLHRVLDNLVKNALEAIGEGPGEVKLRVDTDDGEHLHISVEDTGPGIAEGVQVFRLFETTKKTGTGLGLAVSKQIMLAHGGDLSFVPGEPRGAIFRMELPLRCGE